MKRRMFSREINKRSEYPFMFPANSRNAPPAPVLKVGDRVKVLGREGMGAGTVVSFNEDGRLARVSFSGIDGWWARMDLAKVE